MESSERNCASGWRSVVWTTLVLLVAAVLPSPLPRHQEFERFGPDKVLHFLGHAWLTVTLVDALTADRLNTVPAGVVAVAFSAVHGLATGFLQRYVPGRVPERADFVAGLLGSGSAAIGLWYLSESSVRPGTE